MAAPSSWEDFLRLEHNAVPAKLWSPPFELLDVLVMEEWSFRSWLRRRLKLADMEAAFCSENATRAGSLLRCESLAAAKDEYARFKRNLDDASPLMYGPPANTISQDAVDDNLRDGSRINLKSVTRGTYVCAEDGGGHTVSVNRTKPLGWETFKIWKHSSRPGMYALRTDNNQFLSVSDDGVLNATATVPRESECFAFARNPYNKMEVHIEAHNGMLLQVKSHVEIKADCPQSIHGKAYWEANEATFKMTVLEPEEIDNLLDGSRIQLKSVTQGTFVYAEDGQVSVDREEAGSGGTFKIWKHSNATVYGFRAVDSQFLSVSDADQIVCVTTSEPREAEWFTIRKNPADEKRVHIRSHYGGFLQAKSTKQITADHRYKPGWEDEYVAFEMTVSEPQAQDIRKQETPEGSTAGSGVIQPSVVLVDPEFQWFSKQEHLPDIDVMCTSSTYWSATLHQILMSVFGRFDTKGCLKFRRCHVEHVKSTRINMEKFKSDEEFEVPSEWLKGFRSPAMWVVTEILYARQIEVAVMKLQEEVEDFEFKGLQVHVAGDGNTGMIWTISDPSCFPFAFKVLRLDHVKGAGKSRLGYQMHTSNQTLRLQFGPQPAAELLLPQLSSYGVCGVQFYHPFKTWK